MEDTTLILILFILLGAVIVALMNLYVREHNHFKTLSFNVMTINSLLRQLFEKNPTLNEPIDLSVITLSNPVVPVKV